MSVRRLSWVLLVVAAIAALGAWLVGCSKSTSPTYGGGGGGGGGPAINFTFVNSGESHAFVYTQNGAWAYHCAAHAASGMTGTVNVAAAGADSDSVAVGWTGNNTLGLGFFPSSVSIKTGGKVIWYRPGNVTMTNHSVVSP